MNAESPPGPDGLPFLGSTLEVMRDQFGFASACVDRYGDVVHGTVAGRDYYLLAHPDHVERVLVDNDRFNRSSVVQGLLDALASDSLFVSDGEEWERRRELVEPAFFSDPLESHVDVMVHSADRFVDRHLDGTTFDLHREAKRLTLSVLLEAVFGRATRGEEQGLADAARAINAKFSVEDLSIFVPEWIPTPTNRRYRQGIRQLEAVIDDEIRRCRSGDRDREDMLSLLVSDTAGEGSLDEDELRDVLVGLLFGGYDTTASALTFACCELARHPSVLERIRSEAESVLDGDSPTARDLRDLEYTERVVRETLRLYPPGHTVFRDVTTEVTFDGYRIPAGATVVLPQLVVHRDERWYDEPDAFRPGRWTEASEDRLHNYAYFPFGGGPRHCLGSRFAIMEMQVVLSTLARRARIRTDHLGSPDFEAGITLRPSNDVRARLTSYSYNGS